MWTYAKVVPSIDVSPAPLLLLRSPPMRASMRSGAAPDPPCWCTCWFECGVHCVWWWWLMHSTSLSAKADAMMPLSALWCSASRAASTSSSRYIGH